MTIEFPPEIGGYRIYLSPVENDSGWAYQKGEPFILIDADVTEGQVHVAQTYITTKRALQLQRVDFQHSNRFLELCRSDASCASPPGGTGGQGVA